MENQRLAATGAHTNDVQAIKLCMGPDHRLWYLLGDGVPTLFADSVDEFVKTKQFRSAPSVRILGMSRNAELLNCVYRTGTHLYVASPAMLQPKAQRNDPAAVLRFMRSLDPGMPASLGGWRKMCFNDLIPYSVLHSCQYGEVPHAIEMLKLLPVYKTWKFFDHLDDASMAAIVANILDPRWFVSVGKPDSVSKLRAHMGLSPHIVHAAANDETGPQVERYRLMVDCWQGQRPANIQLPCGYLWRHYENSGHELRTLRTTQKFLSFLRYTWLDAIYRQRGGASEPLFEPKYFFNDIADIEAFKLHQQAVCVKES